MSRQGPIRESPRDDQNIDRSEAPSDAEAGELSFDDLPFARAAEPDQAPFVHELQERAEQASHQPSAENTVDGDGETFERSMF